MKKSTFENANKKTSSPTDHTHIDAFLECTNTHVNEVSKLTCIKSYIDAHTIKPKPNELRGMWHRPFEENLDAVIETLDQLKHMGINHLFVETFFNGRLIFSSKRSLIEKHDFVKTYGTYGDHLLLSFIEEGKKRGIAIHAWVENFFVGVYQDEKESPLLRLNPDWAMCNHDGSVLQKNEKNYLFLDPAHHQVKAYLLGLYEDILSLKGLETLHLDYIRYPVIHGGFGDLSDDTGYSKTAMKQFLGHEHDERFMRNVHLDQSLYQSWTDFKINNITDFVKSAYELAKNHHIGLSTAVFGDPQHALKIKCQDWFTWVKQGWIDMVCPMAYYKDSERVHDEIKALVKLTSPYAKACGGIAPAYMGLSGLEGVRQVLSARSAGADGIIMFATQNYLVQSFMGYRPESKIHADMLRYMLFATEEGKQ